MDNVLNTSSQKKNKFQLRRIFVVFGKEIRETLRDKRVLWAVVISPLLFTPALFLFMGFFINQKEIGQKLEKLNIAIACNGTIDKEFLSILNEDASLNLAEFQTLKEAELNVKNRSQRAAIIMPEAEILKMNKGETALLEIVYDASNEKSRIAKERLEEVLKKYNEKVLQARLDTLHLPNSILHPIKTTSHSIASDSAVGGFLLGTILPYIVILGGCFGGMTSAFDICAGEKERGTMETLLVSPASRTEIILGKLLTIFTVSTISSLCSIVGLISSFAAGLFYLGGSAVKGVAISYLSIGVMLLLILPLTLLTSSILLVISTIARNQKEAQAYSIPFMIVIMMPAVLSFILGSENSIGLSLVPILNAALVMKQVLTQIINFKFIILALSSSILYAILALMIVVKLFNREEILFRS